TAVPTLGINGEKNNATMVYFGTGKYMSISDNNDTNTIQSFYALADTGTITSTGSSRTTDLHEKTIATQASGLRTITGEWTGSGGSVVSAVNWSTQKGWFIDFLAPGGTSNGERVISKPLLVFDRLIFPTLVPS